MCRLSLFAAWIAASLDGSTAWVSGSHPQIPRGVQRIADPMSAEASLTFYTLDMCPYAQRCWIVFEELGVPYKTESVNLRDPVEKAKFLEDVNPRGKVPALVDSDTGLTVFESLIINEYLCERFASEGGSSLLPPAADARAKIRLWNEHLDTQLAPAHFTLLMNKDEETAAAKRAALDAALRQYEESLVGPFLCGEVFTLADVSALPFFERLVFSLSHFKGTDPLEGFPRTAEWLRRAMQRESFITTKRPEDKLVALYERFLAIDYGFGGLNKS